MKTVQLAWSREYYANLIWLAYRLGKPQLLSARMHCISQHLRPLFSSGYLYITIDSSSKCLKYSEYIYSSKPYTNISQDSFDKTREDLLAKVKKDKEELTSVIARLLRNKKIL